MRKTVTFIAMAAALTAFADGGFKSDLKNGIADWKIENLGETMTFEVAEYCDARAIIATGSKTKKGGTAWELQTPAFSIREGERVSVMVRTRGNVKMFRFAHGYKGRFLTAVRWYDQDGKELPCPRMFGVDAVPDAWRYSFVNGTAPENTASARVAIGADSPNFGSNDVVAISAVVANVFPPAQAEKVTSLRDDGAVLTGGNPFFPIGIYAVNECAANGNSIEKAFQDLKAAGFNTVHTTRPDPWAKYQTFLDLADKYGLKVFTMPVVDYAHDFYSKSLIPATKHHTSILSWYLADDTASHVGPEIVSERHRICKTLDPDHLTLHADAVNFGRFAPFVHASDVFLPEIYPCFDEKASGKEVAEVIRDMKEVSEAITAEGRPVKSVWPIIQHFDGWGWKRFPTFAELKAMSWEGIIHGGKGIVWYVYHSKSGRGRGVATTPEHWQEMTRVASEIASVQNDLLTRDAPAQPMVKITKGPKKDLCGFSSVSALLKTGAAPLLITANSSTNAVRATIAISGFKSAGVLFENRTLDAADGIADDFEPYAVHIYRLK